MSQFTLLAKTTKGNKPDFHGSAGPEEASRIYHYFVEKVKSVYKADMVQDGKFQAMMEVALVNDGPVSTVVIISFDDRSTNLLSGHARVECEPEDRIPKSSLQTKRRWRGTGGCSDTRERSCNLSLKMPTLCRGDGSFSRPNMLRFLRLSRRGRTSLQIEANW